MAIDVVIDAGFTRPRVWILDGVGRIIVGMAAPRDAAVYAFVVEHLVKYICESRAGIPGRMSNYRLGLAWQRSARVHIIINEHVTAGTLVDL